MHIDMPITPPDEHVMTARALIEQLYEKLELETDRAVLSAAADAGWPPEVATKALAELRMNDAMSVLRR